MSDSNTCDSRIGSESIDADFSVLASTECRYVVYYFLGADEDVASLDELAEFVESSVDAGTGRSREQIEAALHHRALPKLDSRGVAEYDPSDGRVRYHGSRGLEELAAVAARTERREG